MRTRIVLVVIAALAAALLPAPPADAAIDPFIDDDNSRFESFIETAAELRLVRGCNPPSNDRFCPSHQVTRGEMATMIARAIGASNSSVDHYQDDEGHFAEGAIDALADVGVTHGCAPASFCPDRAIRRGEMAVLLTRAFSLGSSQTATFDDLTELEPHLALARLAEAGGVLACNPPVNSQICPDATVRKDEAAFALVRAMGLSPALSIPDAPEVERLEFGDDFEDLDLWDGRTPGTRNRVSITEAGFRDSALRVSIPRGSHFGADFKLNLDQQSDRVREHLFFRYYLRFDDDWATSHSGKLPGFSGVYGTSGKGGYESSPEDPGWSARLMFSPSRGDDNLVPIGYYVYHLGQARQYGDGMYWNDAGQLRPGDWYCLEGEIEINSPGLSDGVLRAWVDGTPAFDLEGLEFRRPDEPQINVESFWFDVYYGGKPTAPRELGLTVDEVVVDTNRIGCGETAPTATPARGDFDGDGYTDIIWWDTCPEGTCFWMETRSDSGTDSKKPLGDGAWFSTETSDLGLASGDLDGNGLDDLIYRGRCEGGEPCWRVHLQKSGGLGGGRDWGDGARYTAAADQLVLGDFDGDGRDDLTYLGTCGDDTHLCWRTHLSQGDGFAESADWGPSPKSAGSILVGDVNGDDVDDLLYQTRCGETTCWFSQTAGTKGFTTARNVGTARMSDDRDLELIDLDGDSRDDLVAWGGSALPRTVAVRSMTDTGLGDPWSAGVFSGAVTDLYLRKASPSAPVQAIAHVACGEMTTCIEYRVVVAGRVLAVPNRPVLAERSLPHVV